VVDLVAWKVALDRLAEMHAPLFRVTLIVVVVVWPAPTPLVSFATSWKVAGLTPTLLFNVNTFDDVVVFPLFHFTTPVLFAPFPAAATVVVQFCCVSFVVDLLVPLVIPLTPLQPVSLADSVTVEFTFVLTPSFGNAGFHVSVPVNDLHFGGNGPAAPAGAAADTASDPSNASATNSPKPLRMNAPLVGPLTQLF
jgi:hypothetical protein